MAAPEHDTARTEADDEGMEHGDEETNSSFEQNDGWARINLSNMATIWELLDRQLELGQFCLLEPLSLGIFPSVVTESEDFGNKRKMEDGEGRPFTALPTI